MTPQEIIQAIDNARRTEGFDPGYWVFRVSAGEMRKLLRYRAALELVSSEPMPDTNEIFIFGVRVEAS